MNRKRMLSKITKRSLRIKFKCEDPLTFITVPEIQDPA